MAKKEKKSSKKKKPPKTEKKPGKEEESESFRGIVRIAGKDVGGKIRLRRALSRVKGIGHTMAQASCNVITKEMSLSPDMQVGNLTEDQIEKMDKILFNLENHNVPDFMLNRRRDFKRGENRHVIMNDLIFETSQDVDREKKMYSWKGFRHTYGQKVRGQKTRNTGRSGMAVGVLRKAVIAAQSGKGGAKGARGDKGKK
jgi:small subunit ribosomal protein S13